MTAAVTFLDAPDSLAPPDRDQIRRGRSRHDGELPPLTPRLQLARAALVVLFVLCAAMLFELLVVSRLQHHASQTRLYDAYRARLAEGTAPIGPTDDQNRMLPIGTPIAYLEIPAIDVQEVVLDGTTSSVLFSGPGHRRDSPLPGQVGTSVIYGRASAFGGPFGDIGDLQPGAAITVTTGQGEFHYKVLGVRREGGVVPAVSAGSSHLVLATADGASFFPSGVLRVDAELDGDPVVGPARVFTSATLPAEERAMRGDSGTLWVLAFWLQGLIALSLGAVWAWHRWGRAQAWIVFVPPLALVGLGASGEFVRLLPNLL